MPDSIHRDLVNFDSGIIQISHEGKKSEATTLPQASPLPPSQEAISREIDEIFKRFKATSSQQFLLQQLKPHLPQNYVISPSHFNALLEALELELPELRRLLRHQEKNSERLRYRKQFRNDKKKEDSQEGETKKEDKGEIYLRFEKLLQQITADRKLLMMYRNLLLKS